MPNKQHSLATYQIFSFGIQISKINGADLQLKKRVSTMEIPPNWWWIIIKQLFGCNYVNIDRLIPRFRRMMCNLQRRFAEHWLRWRFDSKHCTAVNVQCSICSRGKSLAVANFLDSAICVQMYMVSWFEMYMVSWFDFVVVCLMLFVRAGVLLGAGPAGQRHCASCWAQAWRGNAKVARCL